MSEDLLQQTVALLEQSGRPYTRLRHASATDGIALSQARGMPRSDGVKALLMKVRDAFILLALRAHQRTDNRTVRHALGAQRLRFARTAELRSWGLVPGQIPPIGHPLLPFDLVADVEVFNQERVVFTAGSSTDSFVIGTEDWRAIARPMVTRLTRSGE